MVTKLPKKNEAVYAILSDGSIVKHIWEGTAQQMRTYWQGNYFETPKAAGEEKQRRVMEAVKAVQPHHAPAPLFKPESIEVAEVNGKESLVMDGMAVDFETLLKICQEYKKQHG